MKQFSYLKLLLLMLLLSVSQFVNAQCSASFNWTIDSNGLATFTNTSIGTYDTAQWSFGDGTGMMTASQTTSITHQYNAVGPFYVCLTIYAFNGPCQSTSCDTVIGNPAGGNCVAYFTGFQISGTMDVSFTNYSTGTYSSMQWSFGDGTYSSASNPLHVYAQSGTYSVCLNLLDSNQQVTCSYCDWVTVSGIGSQCNAYFSHQNNGSTYYFFSTNTSGLNYSWTFGDGTNSSAQNPTHIYVQTGNYQVCLTVTDSALTCTDTYCDSISITSTGSCQANFSFNYNPQNGSIVNFTDLSSGGSSYYWDFGDSTFSASQNPNHTFTQNGTYYVCLTITSFLPGCTSTYCAYITIGNSTGCQAYFTASPDTSNGVQFANLSSGNYIGQYWYFGDGSSSTQSSPFHQYAASGTYLVCLSLYYNGAICDSYCDSIIVGNPANSCVPVFYSYPDSTFGNGTINFGVFNNCALTQYIWNFGDGTFGSGLNPVHQYADSGWYYVCVTAGGPAGSFTYCDSVYSNRMSMVGVNEHENNYSFSIYPNPLTETGTVKLNLQSASHVMLDVYSITGKYILNVMDVTIQNGASEITVDVSKLQAGLYLLHLNINNNISYRKISILK